MTRKLDDLREWTMWRFRLHRPSRVWLALAVAAGPAAIVLALWTAWSGIRPAPLPVITILGVVISVAMQLAIVAFPVSLWVQNRKAAARRRKQRRRIRTVKGAVDWPSITNYVDLCSAASDEDPATLDAFMGGPFRRYMELCADEGDNASVRARTMEFARWTVDEFRKRRARWPWAARELDAAVAAELERRFGEDRRWLIEVYEGRRGHH